MVHETFIKTRFSETDALGHINNANYLTYFEQGRLEFLEQQECEMDITNWKFILAHVSCDYINQAYYNQLLRIETSIIKVGTKSFRFLQEMKDAETGDMVARSESVMIYFNYSQQQSEAIPADLVEKLSRYQVTLS